MNRTLSTVLAALVAPSAALAGTITQSVAFDYRPFEGTTLPVIEGFDTLGGARQLTNVTFEFQHRFELELYMESMGPTPVHVGDFSFNLWFSSIYQLGTIGDDGTGNPPFFGPGGFSIDNFSADLAPYDGIPGNDGPDSIRQTFTDAYSNVQSYSAAEQDVLDAVTVSGPLTTVYGGFGELFFYWNNDPNWPLPPNGVPEYPNDAALWANFENFHHAGNIIITYEYIDVPAPMSLLPLAGLALVGRRRR